MRGVNVEYGVMGNWSEAALPVPSGVGNGTEAVLPDPGGVLCVECSCRPVGMTALSFMM